MLGHLENIILYQGFKSFFLSVSSIFFETHCFKLEKFKGVSLALSMFWFLFPFKTLAGNIPCQLLAEQTAGVYFSVQVMGDTDLLPKDSEVFGEGLVGIFLKPGHRMPNFTLNRYATSTLRGFDGDIGATYLRRAGSAGDRCQLHVSGQMQLPGGSQWHSEFFEVIALMYGPTKKVQTLWLGQRDEEGGEVFYVLDKRPLPNVEE